MRPSRISPAKDAVLPLPVNDPAREQDHTPLLKDDGMLREAKPTNLHVELFERYADNPILTAQDWPYPAHTVFNAGACQLGDETILLVRVEDRRGHSHLTVARSNNGVSNWHIDSKPSFAANPASFSHTDWVVVAPRLTWEGPR